MTALGRRDQFAAKDAAEIDPEEPVSERVPAKHRPAQQLPNQLLSGSDLRREFEHVYVVEVAEAEQGRKIGTAETVLVCQGDVVARIRAWSLHVRRAQQE